MDARKPSSATRIMRNASGGLAPSPAQPEHQPDRAEVHREDDDEVAEQDPVALVIRGAPRSHVRETVADHRRHEDQASCSPDGERQEAG